MKIIGVCGSSGSGKSTFTRCFSQLGFPVFNCDEIYHDLVNSPSDCLTEIGESFGTELIKNGFLDRKKLGEIVFSDKEKLSKLNTISHRHVIAFIEEQIERLTKNDEKFCVIDAPLLFESGLDKRCDLVVAVVSEENAQIERICLRDGIDFDRAKKRIQNQISSEKLKKLADVTIENNGSCDELYEKCKEFITSIMKQGENYESEQRT